MNPQDLMVQYRLGALQRMAEESAPILGELRTVLSAVPTPEGWVALNPTGTTQQSRSAYPQGSQFFPLAGSAPTTQAYPVAGETGNDLYFRGNCWATESGKIIYWGGTNITVEDVCPGAGVVLAYMPFGGNRAAALVRLENGTYGYRRRLNGVWSVVTYGGTRDASLIYPDFDSVSWAAVISPTQMAFITERYNEGSGVNERITYVWNFADYTNDPPPQDVLTTPATGEMGWEQFQGFAGVLTSYAWGTEEEGSRTHLLLWDLTAARPRPMRVAMNWDNSDLRGAFMADTNHSPVALISSLNYFPMRYRYLSGITADGLGMKSYHRQPVLALSTNGFASSQVGPQVNPSPGDARFLTGSVSAGEGDTYPAASVLSGFEGGYPLSFPALGYGRLCSGMLVVNTSDYSTMLLAGLDPTNGAPPTSLVGVTFPTGALDNMVLPASDPGAGKKDLVFLGVPAPLGL